MCSLLRSPGHSVPSAGWQGTRFPAEEIVFRQGPCSGSRDRQGLPPVPETGFTHQLLWQNRWRTFTSGNSCKPSGGSSSMQNPAQQRSPVCSRPRKNANGTGWLTEGVSMVNRIPRTDQKGKPASGPASSVPHPGGGAARCFPSHPAVNQAALARFNRQIRFPASQPAHGSLHAPPRACPVTR